ncbi:hypothetical protein ALI144C_06675 [Actinosynnema sp. ALI-1.44]|nr:hypothetical protein ALI144C_06675 [Actinosynnema sp. ALI-1.44]
MRANQIIKLSSTIPALKDSKTVVAGLGSRLQLLGTAAPQLVSTDNGDNQAAPGQRLIVAQVSLDGKFCSTEQPASERSSVCGAVAVLADGSRTVFDPDALDRGENTFAMSVPKGAKDVSLELSTGALKQQVSLVSGELVGPAPAVLYRPDAKSESGSTSVTTNVVERLSFPFALYDESGRLDFDGDYPTIVDVSKARLSYAIEKPDREMLLPSAVDRAFLTLDTKVSGGNTWRTVLDPKSFVVTTADGKSIPAERFDADSLRDGDIDHEHQFIGGDLYWEVPGDLKDATVTITAGKNHQMGMLKSRVLDYRGATRSFPVRF